MSTSNLLTGFFSGRKGQTERAVTDISGCVGSVWHGDSLITRPNGSQTALKNLVVGDKIRSLAPRAEWVGKMLNADGSYNGEALSALWEPGYAWTRPNSLRFAPEYIPTPGRVPNGNEFVLGEAEIAYIAVYATQNKPYVGTEPTLFFTVYYRPETTPNAAENWISGHFLYAAMPQIAEAADSNQFVFLARNGVYSNWPNDAYMKTGKPNTFRLIKPASGGLPAPSDGTTAWNSATNRARVTRDAPYPKQGSYIEMILKKVDGNSSPAFLVNGMLVI